MTKTVVDLRATLEREGWIPTKQLLWMLDEIERLRVAIEKHQARVCDNPKAAGQQADEELWAILDSADEPEKTP